MKTKKILKNTAFYGLVVPGAAVVDTAFTAVSMLTATVITTVATPFASVKQMKNVRKRFSQTPFQFPNESN